MQPLRSAQVNIFKISHADAWKNNVNFDCVFLLLRVCFLLFYLPMSIFAQHAAELPEQTIEKEASAEIMGFSLGDSDVSLFLTGSWKGNLQTNLGYSFSPLGDAPVSPETPLLFTQEVDLTLSL